MGRRVVPALRAAAGGRERDLLPDARVRANRTGRRLPHHGRAAALPGAQRRGHPAGAGSRAALDVCLAQRSQRSPRRERHERGPRFDPRTQPRGPARGRRLPEPSRHGQGAGADPGAARQPPDRPRTAAGFDLQRRGRRRLGNGDAGGGCPRPRRWAAPAPRSSACSGRGRTASWTFRSAGSTTPS